MSKPSTRQVAAWRVPWWAQLALMVIGGLGLAGGLTYLPDPQAFMGTALGAGAIALALRPKVTLYEDAVTVRGLFVTRVIPIEEVFEVVSGRDGATIAWGDAEYTTTYFIGETGWLLTLPSERRQIVDLRTRILGTRDTYLAEHGLQAPVDPQLAVQERQREFERRGWVEIPVDPPTPVERAGRTYRRP